MGEGIVNERVKAKDLLKKIKDALKDTENENIIKHHDELVKAKDVYYTKADGLKIVINSGLFGKLGDENSFLFDLKAMYEVTINNQLYLMMLIEMLYYAGIDNISANTDGIISKVPVDMKDTFYRVCEEWEKITKFNLEYNTYEKYVCHSVNNYIGISKGYSNSNKDNDAKASYIKEKGLFITNTQIDKGYKHPITSKALLAYYTDGVSIEDTIYNSNDIYDFCISIKTGADFIKEYHYVKDGEVKIEILPKNVRYYISNRGGMIMKRYTTPFKDAKGTIREYISLHSKRYSTIFNDYFEVDNFKDYNIDYSYYIGECYKIINEISNAISLKQKRRNYGGLFD